MLEPAGSPVVSGITRQPEVHIGTSEPSGAIIPSPKKLRGIGDSDGSTSHPSRVAQAQSPHIGCGLWRQRERDRRRSAVPAPGIARVRAPRRPARHGARSRGRFTNKLHTAALQPIGNRTVQICRSRQPTESDLGAGRGRIPERLDGKRKITGVDIVTGCVDTRPARVAIAECVEDWSEVDYWLDLGNNAKGGQFVLGVTSESKKPAEEASAAHGFGALPGSHPTGAGQRRPAELQRCGSSGAARALRKSDIGESRPCTAGSLVPVWGHFIPRSLHGSLIVTWSAAVAR